MNIERISGSRVKHSIGMVDYRWDLLYSYERELREAQKFATSLGGRPISTSAYDIPPETVMVGIVSLYTMDDDNISWKLHLKPIGKDGVRRDKLKIYSRSDIEREDPKYFDYWQSLFAGRENMTLAECFIPPYQPADGVNFPPPARDITIMHIPARSREGGELSALGGLYRVEFNLPRGESLDWFDRYNGSVYVFDRTPKFITQVHQSAKRHKRWVETYAAVSL